MDRREGRTAGFLSGRWHFCAALFAAVVSFPAADMPLYAEDRASAQDDRLFSSPVEALKDVIRAGALSSFSARGSYSSDEWLSPAGPDGLSPAELAISRGQIAAIPEPILKSPRMKESRWREVGGVPLLLHAIRQDMAQFLLTDEERKTPLLMWGRDAGGELFAKHVIAARALKNIPSDIFQATPYDFWQETKPDGVSLIDQIVTTRQVFDFFKPENWIGKTDEMQALFTQSVKDRYKVLLPGSAESSMHIVVRFNELHKKAVDLTGRIERQREELRKSNIRADVPAGAYSLLPS